METLFQNKMLVWYKGNESDTQNYSTRTGKAFDKFLGWALLAAKSQNVQRHTTKIRNSSISISKK